MGRNIGVILSLKDKFSPQIKKVGAETGIAENKIKKARLEILKFQKSAVGAAKNVMVGVGAMAMATGAGLWALSMKATEAGDRIDELSQSLSLSRGGFQEWEYVLGQNGVEMENLQGGMKSLTKNIMSATQGGKKFNPIFKQMGVNIRDNEGKLRSQEAIFNDTVDALQKMPDGVNKAALAQKLFGKSGMALLPVLNAQAGSVEELKKRAHSLGIVLSDEMIDNAAKMDDTMKDVEKTFGAIGLTIGASALPAFQALGATIVANMPKIKVVATAAFGAISGAIGFVISNMNWLIPVAITCVSSILAFRAVVGIGNMMIAYAKIIETVGDSKKLLTIINHVFATSEDLVAAKTAIVTLATWAQTAATAALGFAMKALPFVAVIGFVSLIAMNWDKVTAAAGNAIAVMKNAFGLGGGDAKKPAKNKAPVAKSLPKHATGTSYARGGMAIVGERGMEAVNLKRGDTVTNARDTAKAISKPVTVNLNINGNMVGNKQFAQYISNLIAGDLTRAMAAV